MSKSTKYVIPESFLSRDNMKLANGEDFTEAMVGAYYASGLEYNMVTVPQYANAGDTLCYLDDEVRKVFKPKRPFGTFGALVRDTDQSQYREEVGRGLVELTSEEDVLKVADSLDSSVIIESLKQDKDMKYNTKDGRVLNYDQVMQEMHNWREHNKAIQAQIEEVISRNGLQPTFKNGKKNRPAYPAEVLGEIQALAAQKKSVTGLVIKIQITGKHTIAKDGNYFKSSISSDEVDLLRSKFAYREKNVYTQGNVRVGTIIVPIQSVRQLKAVMRCMKTEWNFVLSSWPEHVKASYVKLEKKAK